MILNAVTSNTKDQDQNPRDIGTTEKNATTERTNTTKIDWNANILIEKESREPLKEGDPTRGLQRGREGEYTSQLIEERKTGNKRWAGC